jgi:hypothetical protein
MVCPAQMPIMNIQKKRQPVTTVRVNIPNNPNSKRTTNPNLAFCFGALISGSSVAGQYRATPPHADL